MFIGGYQRVRPQAASDLVKALAPVALNPEARYFINACGAPGSDLATETRYGLPVSGLLDTADVRAATGANDETPGEGYRPGDTFAVLNYGFVEYMDVMGDDDAIADAARTSYTGGKRTQKNDGLLRYLLRHQHTTPFEMGELKFRLYIPIFVYRQLFRHRTASQLEPEISECITNDTAFQAFSVQNEMSGRYVEMPNHYFVPEAATIQKQSLDNKQGRGAGFDTSEQRAIRERLEHEAGTMREWYMRSIGDDVAKELSRVNLPLSQYTLLIWKIDLKNLMHFIALRLHPHAQYEVRQYARALYAAMRSAFPATAAAFRDYMLEAERFTREELIALRGTLPPDQRMAVWQAFAARCKNGREQAEFAAKLGIEPPAAG